MTAGVVPVNDGAVYKPRLSHASPILAKNLTYFKPALSEIKFGKMRFLLTDRPRPSEFALENFVKELKRNKVKTVVRVCEPTYSKEYLKKQHGIEVLDWEFVDGSPPPEEIIEKWLLLVRDYFDTDEPVLAPIPNGDLFPKLLVPEEKAIAVHCVAGLGRAPVLVGIALMEAGMPCEDAIFQIRSNRRGALNEKQLEFLKGYKPGGKLRKLRYPSSHMANKERKSCALM